MFEHIVKINDRGVLIKLGNVSKDVNIMGLHLMLHSEKYKIVCEIDGIDGDIINAHYIGEVINNKFQNGVLNKPDINANIRFIDDDEINMIIGVKSNSTFTFGTSPFYDNKSVYVDINNIFSNHLTILGNSGCGKSYGTADLIQSIFKTDGFLPFKSNIIFFDNNGEYISAFEKLSSINPNYHFQVITTNNALPYKKLSIPLWLLGVDDIALLLSATTANQMILIERMIKLARIFSQNEETNIRYKNHLLAKAMLSIIYSNDIPDAKRNKIFGLFNTCQTNELNMEAVVQGAGYTRKFRDCFFVDKNGVFTEGILITEYISSFVNAEFDEYEPRSYNSYSLSDLEKALAFSLVSEDWLNNPLTYSDAIALKVKLHTLAISENAKFFDMPGNIKLDQFLVSLLMENGGKNQILNINLEDIDDSLAKVIVKVFCRMFFEYAKKLPDRGAVPFNIFVEEAHRYIKTGEDIDLLGYNIFDRISKEGRKYGVLLNLISQRPVELSETVMSQCANYLIFKTTHPRDIEYITQMVPYITEEIIEKQKGLQPGYCLAFGSAFKVPVIIKMNIPNPVPNSDNVDIIKKWSITR